MCDSRQRGPGRRAVRLLLALAFTAVLGACQPFQLKGILDGPKGMALSLSPASIVVPADGTVSFSAIGGVPPYVYSLVSGGGTLDPHTGVYTAPVGAGTAKIRVTDKTLRAAQASIVIEAFASSLAVTPASLSLQVGSNVTFTAIGGTPPYTYSIQSAGSGSPSVTPGTGYYVAGGAPGTDVIRVTDAALATTTASVTVTVVTSSVDYTVPSTSFPAAGTIASAIPGGSFTLRNSGTGPGTQPVDWKLFLSSNTLIDGGDLMIASGTTGPLAAGASAPVPIAGTFPSVPPGGWFLIAQVSAADDTSPANNNSGAGSITLSPLNINYTPTGPTSTGTTQAGSSMSGSLGISNIGSAGDTGGADWAVYASLDTALDPSDYLVARGNISGLGGGAGSGPIAFTGYWPSTPNTWYLIAQVSAANDVAPGNDITVGPAVVVSGPPPANVDYVVVSVNNTGGATAGDPLTGSFTVHNNGSDPGAQPVFWTAYLSSNATLEIGTDPVIDSGSFAALGAGATSAVVPFAGTWPAGTATWRLIVAVSGPDDVAPANNVTASSAVSTTAPDVDYAIQSVISTGGMTAGSALSGSFVIHNAGTHAGSQFIPLSVYLSSDASLNIGTDMLLATGSVPAPGLAAGASTAPIPFAGTWPASTVPRTWYLIAHIGAGDDVNTANDTGASAAVLVNPPNIDYDIPAVPGVTSTGGTTGGGPITGSFVLRNNGTVNGTAPVSWTAYASSNATLDVTDQAVDTGTAGPLSAGGSTVIGFGGTWPAGTATWYLIVKLSAPDDVNSANDTLASSPVLVTGAAPVYSITAVPVPAGSTTGQAVNGTISIRNTALTPGVSPVTWQVYASLGDAVYNAGDTLLASGSVAGLGAGATTSPAWAGTWPAAAGTYFLVVRVSAADAPVVPDAASTPIVVSNPPPPDYTVSSFDPNIPWSGIVGTAMSLTGTTQFTIQNQTANVGHATIAWAVYLSLDKVLDGGDTLVQSGSIGPLAGSGSTVIPFAGTWPSSKTYYLIATVNAADDTNHTNDTVPAPHVSAVGDFRYQEGAELNGGVGPNPPVAQTSATLASLAANQTLVIEGTMDTANGYDTYKFATVASVTKFSIRTLWATGFDDLDMYLWDTGATNLSSLGTGIDSEPGGSTWDITGVTAGTSYVSVQAYLNGGTSGDTGKKYVITVVGLP